VLRVKLRYLDEWNARRRQVAARYGELLAGSDLTLPQVTPSGEPVWHLYVVQTPNRASLQQSLDEANIGHGIHYPVPIHLQPAYADLGYARGDFPVAEALAERIMSLPMFPEITDEELERVGLACQKARSRAALTVGQRTATKNSPIQVPAQSIIKE
jgi:dTDP-4-amino-4,6-dideoxygalactose transaminase